MYVNGFSSSLPEEVQYNALRKVPGFENCKFFRPGYAIEYDFFPPTQLKTSLETHLVKNLFFAGQINGTTGYEEAGSQGLMAGINAHLAINDHAPFVLKRSDAYIGVLIDDLVNKGTKEPYRMFTSRAEHRILLRQDNADIRLTPIAHELGMQNLDQRMERVREKEEANGQISKFLADYSVSPEMINQLLEDISSSLITQKVKLIQILSRPHVTLKSLCNYVPDLKQLLNSYDQETIQLAEINTKYAGYIKREMDMAEKLNRLESVKLLPDMNYLEIKSLSAEAREKLTKMKPATIGQASRISGVSPSDISVLLVHIGR